MSFLDDVLEGLSRPQKTISPKYFYDQRGSEIFEEITQIEDYYPTRTEASIFEVAFPELAEQFPTGGVIAEYGSGASVKTIALIRALKPAGYYPIDISAEFMKDAAAGLEEEFGTLDVHPITADFTLPVTFPDSFLKAQGKLGFFPGSTIGNLDPVTAINFLRTVQSDMGPGARFLLGADLIKDKAVLEAAYNDRDGLTAAFNMNLLTRMNRELGADFDLSAFHHRAIFDENQSRIEMHLVSDKEQTVTIGNRSFSFAPQEYIHTENSYKFSFEGFERLALKAGWRVIQTWTDTKEWFGVFLMEGV